MPSSEVERALTIEETTTHSWYVPKDPVGFYFYILFICIVATTLIVALSLITSLDELIRRVV